ncbi:MAG: hypothetical protein HRU34_08065 [Richelia sp.]|nr:hypothetical protein [Richelia sp.]
MENIKKPPQESVTPVVQQEKQEELMHDVLILLENLIHREETTVKLIVDSLYDVGTVNIINQKFKSRTFNKTLKLVSRVSKPAFKIIAWSWVKKNCPELITNWLQRKVSFEQAKTKPQKAELVVAQQNIAGNILPPVQDPGQEVKYLRSRVNLLTTLLIGSVIGSMTLVGGSVFWLSHEMQQSRQQTIQEIQALHKCGMN